MIRATRRGVLAGGLAAGGALFAARAGLARTLPAPHLLSLTAPDGRSIAVSDWRGMGRERGLILFSHGAASSPRFYEALVSAWTAGGWRVLAPLHVDSAEHRETGKYPGLASWKARIEDMRALSAHVGARPWVAAGHSYGGLVALTLGGAAAVPPKGIEGSLSDRNVRAVLAFSPPAPIPVLVTAEGYGALKVPALIQTGTADLPPAAPGAPPATAESWKGHLAPYEAAAAGHDRYALVLDGVDHYFGGAICRYDLAGPKQLARLEDAKRLSLLFLAAHGANDAAARKRLLSTVSDQLPVRLLHK